MAKKTNPITGQPMPESITRLSSMSGYDRKREPVVSGPGRGTAPPAPQSGGTIRGQVKTSKTNSSKDTSKSRLERKMDKYGVEPASSKLSASQQKQFNKNRVKLAKDKLKAEKRQEKNANPTKFDTFVMKTLGKGKYDKGGKKNMDMGGNKSKMKVDKAGQKTQDAECKISMAGKFKQAFKKQKPAQNTMWTISK